MCYPTSGNRVMVRHEACGEMQELVFERGEPQSYEHPGTPDEWWPDEPICCELAENDTQLQASAYDAYAGTCTGACQRELEDLPR